LPTTNKILDTVWRRVSTAGKLIDLRCIVDQEPARIKGQTGPNWDKLEALENHFEVHKNAFHVVGRVVGRS